MSSDNPAELSNSELAQEVIKACWQAGCREFVVCAGSRNSPLVLELLNLEQITEGLKLWNFFEERSAAFFALGRSKSSGAPTAVVTTSGTAAAELLPAVVEAHYAGIPMILVTADRPQSFANSGAPQTIEQKGLTKPFTEICIDVNTSSIADFEGLNDRKDSNQRWHINVRFDEKDRLSTASLLDQYIVFRDQASGKIKEIPISAIVDMDNSVSFSAIKHKELRRVVTVYSAVLAGYNANEVVDHPADECIVDRPIGEEPRIDQRPGHCGEAEFDVDVSAELTCRNARGCDGGVHHAELLHEGVANQRDRIIMKPAFHHHRDDPSADRVT